MNNKNILKSIYDIRALIYTLLITASLLFLLNFKELSNNFIVYLMFIFVMLLASSSEFLFAIRYSSQQYHKKHPLYTIYRKLQKHHLYNVILLPIVQYIVCALLIYFNNEQYVNLFAIILSSIMTYFTFFAYRDIYSNNLQVHHLVEEFFDGSRYVSFAFITYLLLLIQTTFAYPRSFTAVIIGLVQLLYISSSLWRRNQLYIKHFFICFVLSIVLSASVYALLLVFNLPSTLLFMELTSQILIIDYVMSSLVLRYINKHLNFSIILEYTLIVLIAVSLLYYSR